MKNDKAFSFFVFHSSFFIKMFNALVLEKQDKTVSHHFKQLSVDDLPPGEVLLETAYSSLNYKDGLAVTNKGRIVFNFPMVPGIDGAGTVVESASPEYKPGDKVIFTGWETGERHWGGYAQMCRTQANYLVSLPDEMSLQEAMIIGTAGFTAMLAVMLLEEAGLNPTISGLFPANVSPLPTVKSEAEVIVTGASGGVGSMAIAILAELGYRAVASTGRTELTDYLTALGASEIVDRSILSAESRGALASERWAGAVDNVGGPTLANLCKQLRRGASVAACGLAGSYELPTTVFPFILRGARLLGVDSNMCPKPRRQHAWNRLATLLPKSKLQLMNSATINLTDLPEYAELILQGKTRGRVVVDVNGEA